VQEHYKFIEYRAALFIHDMPGFAGKGHGRVKE
jgi:hypothetical protein